MRTSDPNNLVACCEGCNLDKADLLPLEFLWAWGTRFRPNALPAPARRPASPAEAYARTWNHPRLSARPAS